MELAFIFAVILGLGNSVIMGCAAALLWGNMIGAILGVLSFVVSCGLFLWGGTVNRWSDFVTVVWFVVALCISAAFLVTKMALGGAILISIMAVGIWAILFYLLLEFIRRKR